MLQKKIRDSWSTIGVNDMIRVRFRFRFEFHFAQIVLRIPDQTTTIFSLQQSVLQTVGYHDIHFFAHHSFNGHLHINHLSIIFFTGRRVPPRRPARSYHEHDDLRYLDELHRRASRSSRIYRPWTPNPNLYFSDSAE